MFVNLKWDKIVKKILKEAVKNTAKKRKTENYITQSGAYIRLIEEDSTLKSLWQSYISNYEYAKEISYEDIIESVKKVFNIVNDY